MITRRQWLQAISAMISAVALGSRSSIAQASVKNIKVAIGQKSIAPNLVNLLIG